MIAADAWRMRTGTIAVSVEAGQPLVVDADGALSYTRDRPNCVALESVELLRGDELRTIKIQMLDGQPPAWASKICNCTHPAGMHRSSDDHCNAPGCACTRPSCGH